MTDERALTNAQAFAAWGFGVFSVWGVDGGICRCPKGPDCTSPGKHPIPHDGLKSATTDEVIVARMLAAAGSGGQYGVVPAANVIVLDVDGEGWMDKLRTLALPKTLAVQTANGVHLYFHWPESHGPQPTRLFEWVVRSQEHPGYVIGPGSVHQTGVEYVVAHQNGHDIHEMLATIATFPVERRPPPEGESRTSITMSEGLRPPERVPVGGRHDYLRDRARTLRGGGLTGTDLFDAVSALNRRLPEPKSDEEVLRAIGDVEVKFGEDPLPPPTVDASAVPFTDLITTFPQYHAVNDAAPEWVSPLVSYGTVALVSGPPKSGKSTLIVNLMRAREDGSVFLWGDPVPKGPMLLVTEEGGFPVVRKTVGLTTGYVLDRMAFVTHGLTTLDHLLTVLSAWDQTQESEALVIIDTLAVWGDIKDENDAVAATHSITTLRVWAQMTGAAVVLIHHTRKGGGEHGEAIRGSGGIFAAVDQSIELGFGLDPKADARTLTIAGRLAYGESKRLVFDRESGTYAIDMAPPPDDLDLDQFPMDGSGEDGLTREDAEKVWGLAPSRTNEQLKRMVEQGRLTKRQVRLPGKRVAQNAYWKTRPLLVVDNRSVGERMADIMARKDASDDPAD